MARFTMERRVAAPREKVFALYSNFEGAADTVGAIDRVEMLTDGPVGVGTRFRETRTMFKREATEEMEVTKWEPGRSYTLSALSCGVHFDSTFHFTDDGDGTRVVFEFESTPKTFMAKLMSPLGALMMGPMKKCMAEDFDDLQRIAEGSAATE